MIYVILLPEEIKKLVLKNSLNPLTGKDSKIFYLKENNCHSNHKFVLWRITQQAFTCSMSTTDTRKMCKICSKLTKYTRTTSHLLIYFTAFSSVFIVDFASNVVRRFKCFNCQCYRLKVFERLDTRKQSQ